MMAAQGLDVLWCLCFLFLLFLNFAVSGSNNGMYQAYIMAIPKVLGLDLIQSICLGILRRKKISFVEGLAGRAMRRCIDVLGHSSQCVPVKDRSHQQYGSELHASPLVLGTE